MMLVLCSGTHCLHLEEETGRSAIIFLLVERSLGLLVWCRASSSGLKSSFSSSSRSSDYTAHHRGSSHTSSIILSKDMQERLLSIISDRFENNSKNFFQIGLEEGFIDLFHAKKVALVDSKMDLSGISKRCGLKPEDVDSSCCLKLLYGSTLNDNRTVEFILPKASSLVWIKGLTSLILELRKQTSMTDQRVLWLKSKYLELYYRSASCRQPTPADAIKMFGGRKWILTGADVAFQSSFIDSSSIKSAKSSSFELAKCKLLQKKKSTPSFSSISGSSGSDSKAMSEDPVSDSFRRRHSRFSLRKKSVSIITALRNRRDSLSSTFMSSFSSTPNESSHSGYTNLAATTSASCQSPETSSGGSSISSPTRPTPSPRDKMKNHRRFSSGQRKAGPDPDYDQSQPHQHPTQTTAGSMMAARLKPSITHSSQMNFFEFLELFKAFLIRSRSDIKELFEQINKRIPASEKATEDEDYESRKTPVSGSGGKRPEASGVVTESALSESQVVNLERDHSMDSDAMMPSSSTQRVAAKDCLGIKSDSENVREIPPAGLLHPTCILSTEKRRSAGSLGSATSASSVSAASSCREEHHRHDEDYYDEKQEKQGNNSSNNSVNRTSAASSNCFSGLLTRNFASSSSVLDQIEVMSERFKIWNAIASSSIVSNCAGVETIGTSRMTLTQFRSFLRTYQREDLSEDQVKDLISRHEPDPSVRSKSCLSLEGFACYLMDKENYAFSPELNTYDDHDMDDSLSHYFMATSHNTYLTGHQLKGESSVELYSQVLRAGCRCVELDCWDGDDGTPVIYHGHTLTSKISFEKVIQAIHDNAFTTSPFPVILSLENHCSLSQQSRMAHIFTKTFGDRLVTGFLFDTDYCEDPRLPSPNQLKHKILIKNKKLRPPLFSSIHLKSACKSVVGNVARQTPQRTNSPHSLTSSGSMNEDDDDYEDEEEDDDEELQDAMALVTGNIGPASGTTESSPKQLRHHSSLTKNLSIRTESSSSQEGPPPHTISSELANHGSLTSAEARQQSAARARIRQKSLSSQVSPDLSDLVNYMQAIKFRGLSETNTAIGTTTASGPSSSQATQAGKTQTVTPGSSSSKSSSVGGKRIQAVSSLSNIQSVAGTSSSSSGYESTTCLSHPSSSQVPRASQSSLGSSGGTGTSSQVTRKANPSASSYQVASLNEQTAKKLCRKNPLGVIACTESQIIRSYPAGMRIDSSNFNPVSFWAFGMQMAAINYQTEDLGSAINSAFFEQNGSCGVLKKPSVMIDRNHVMFSRFNPWDKEFDGLYAIDLTVTVCIRIFCRMCWTFRIPLFIFLLPNIITIASRS